MIASPDWQQAWTQHLALTARLRTHSARNVLAILIQHHQAFAEGRVPTEWPTYVAGYQQFRALGYQIRAGSRGYAVLAPVRRQFVKDGSAAGGWRRLERGEMPRPGAPAEYRPVGWTTATVFDISMADGPEIKPLPMPHLIEGQAPTGLWDGLAAQITAEAFTLRDVPDAAELGGANGLTDYLERSVSVRLDMPDLSRARCLTHELAHVLLHGPGKTDAPADRGVKEVEAESVALMTLSAHGVDTSAYTVPYVANWAAQVPGTSPVDVVLNTAERVRRTTNRILERLETEQVPNGEPPGLEAVRTAARVRPTARRGRSARSARPSAVTR